jgi:hypothetical protein
MKWTSARVIGSLIAVTLLVAPALLPGAAGAKQGEWVSLLEGGDFGTHWTTNGNWKTEDGAVRLTPRPGEQGWTRYDAYLWLKDKQYTNFQIEFDYKVEKGGNSGFYFNVGDKKEPVQTGVEVQIYDSYGQKNLNDHTSGGIIPGVTPTKQAAKAAGEWNHFSIMVNEGKVSVVLNGETVNEVPLDHPKLKDRPKSGYIGFQDHALPLWLKDIRIKEL